MLSAAVTVNPERNEGAVARETTAMLGGGIQSAAVTLPPFTPGHLALLSLIQSPLLTGGRVTDRDVLLAAYVLLEGPRAVAPVQRTVRRLEALETASSLIVGHPEAAGDYLAAVSAAAADYEALDAELAKLAFKLGKLPADLAAELSRSLADYVAPFSMVHSSGDGSKKNAGVTPSGSLMSTGQ